MPQLTVTALDLDQQPIEGAEVRVQSIDYAANPIQIPDPDDGSILAVSARKVTPAGGVVTFDLPITPPQSYYFVLIRYGEAISHKVIQFKEDARLEEIPLIHLPALVDSEHVPHLDPNRGAPGTVVDREARILAELARQEADTNRAQHQRLVNTVQDVDDKRQENLDRILELEKKIKEGGLPEHLQEEVYTLKSRAGIAYWERAREVPSTPGTHSGIGDNLTVIGEGEEDTAWRKPQGTPGAGGTDQQARDAAASASRKADTAKQAADAAQQTADEGKATAESAQGDATKALEDDIHGRRTYEGLFVDIGERVILEQLKTFEAGDRTNDLITQNIQVGVASLGKEDERIHGRWILRPRTVGNERGIIGEAPTRIAIELIRDRDRTVVAAKDIQFDSAGGFNFEVDENWIADGIGGTGTEPFTLEIEIQTRGRVIGTASVESVSIIEKRPLADLFVEEIVKPQITELTGHLATERAQRERLGNTVQDISTAVGENRAHLALLDKNKANKIDTETVIGVSPEFVEGVVTARKISVSIRHPNGAYPTGTKIAVRVQGNALPLVDYNHTLEHQTVEATISAPQMNNIFGGGKKVAGNYVDVQIFIQVGDGLVPGTQNIDPDKILFNRIIDVPVIAAPAAPDAPAGSVQEIVAWAQSTSNAALNGSNDPQQGVVLTLPAIESPSADAEYLIEFSGEMHVATDSTERVRYAALRLWRTDATSGTYIGPAWDIEEFSPSGRFGHANEAISFRTIHKPGKGSVTYRIGGTYGGGNSGQIQAGAVLTATRIA